MNDEEAFKLQLEEYKRNLTTVFFKSQEEFEKKLSFISAAGFGASVFLIENVVGKLSDARQIWILIVAWLLLGGTLVLNLISHIIAANKSWATLNDILTYNYNEKIANERQVLIRYLNYYCVGFLCLGLLFLILFFTFNILKNGI